MKQTILLAPLISVAAAYEMDKMAFAYHQIRHGARAPKESNLEHIGDDINEFTVGTKQLTQQGMR